VGKINIDDNQEMATRYGIASIPALLVFKGGEVVDKMVGLQPEANIAKALDKQL
jgi:thioredoxin 1